MKKNFSNLRELACLIQSSTHLHWFNFYIVTLIAMGLLIAHPTRAQTFPPNFAGIQLATGLDPVGMDIAPNGRIFLTEKSGNIRIVSNGTLLPTPFLTIPNVDNYNERGVQGIVLDPDFSTNNFVYVYYTYKAPGGSVSNNRVSRFTANGDIALSGSERVLLDIDPLSSAGNHNGGSLAFKDGKLLISVGENANGDNAQSFTTLKGKILRLNPDGSIPTDNPFYNSTVGNNRAIWALGLRNPFRIVVQPGTGTVFVNDVGQSAYEEINQVVAGKNYGWPGIEGNRTNQTPPTNYQDPVYAYNHDSGCSITAGEFYNPSTAQFPSSYMGKYFFADYCGGWIKTMDPATKSITSFSTGLNRPLVIKVGLDGSLYFIARGGIGGGSDADNTSSNGGVLWKVTYTGNGMPVVAVQPVNKTVSVGESVTFSVSASGTPTPTYQWQRNGVAISGATAASYVLPSVTLNDNGAVFKVVVSNSAGSVTSGEATLTVLTNQKPTATIITPTAGKTYSGGDVIDFSGRGVDPEDGNLPASALSWRVDLYHYDIPTHFHPVLESTSGISSGSFTIPVSGETSPHVLYRIYLTVTDSKGATTTSTVDVNPIQSVITLVSQPAGLTVKFDGTVVTTPFTFTGVSGISRSLDVVDQTKNGSNYTFYSWSDGGAAAHTLNTPSTAATITATYIRSADVVSGVTNGVSYTYVEGEYASLPAFSTLTPVKTGTTTDFTLAPRNREDNFAFLFKGYVDLPTDGKYTFYTQSDDGSRLSIGGAVVVDNDGLHGFLEKSGSIYLKAGKHAIDVTFFERDGDQILNVLYEGPGIGKKTIPSSVLFYAPVGTPGSGGLADGIYELEPQHAIGKRLLVSGAGTADGTEVQIGTANGSVSQGWKLTDVGGGFYDLSPQYILSKRLDVNNAGRENGTKVQIWTSNTTQAQRWKVIDKGNNIYEFAPECALDKRLDVSGVSTSDGTKLITWTSTGGANQRWKLISRSSARLAEERILGDKPVGTGLANYPNPFDQTTTVTFPISSSARQSLIQIYTLQGELVRSIDVSTNQEGRYELSRDRLGDGIYIYRLLGDGILKASQRLIISN